MRNVRAEPGLLQVFRFYAWLRLISLLLYPIPVLLGRVEITELQEFNPPAVFMACYTLTLLGYLYWDWLMRRLGQWYVPLGLTLAIVTLVVEQYIYSFHIASWESQPFLIILLILVAWQYSFQVLVASILGVALLETLLNVFLPQPVLLFGKLSLVFGGAFPYILLVSRSAIFLLIGYVVNRLATAARRQRQSLAEANQKLVSQAAALEQLAVSRERVRLSRELHDTLAHTLSALAVQMDAVLTVWPDAPVRAQNMLERMLSTTRSGLDETRRAMSALRSAPLDEMGSAAALRLLTEDFAARHSLALEMEIQDLPDELLPEVEQCFYRVAQEALENVARHAGATRLEVRLSRSLDTAGAVYELKIGDNGKGFSPDEALPDDRLGLVGMRERAEMIGANLVIDSQPGQGTTVRLRLEQDT